MLKIEKVVTGKWLENCYIVSDSELNAVIIDPGEESKVIINYIETNHLNPRAIINTHAHYDHVGAVSDLKEKFNLDFYLHKKDFKILKYANLYRQVFDSDKIIVIPTVDIDLSENNKIALGNIIVQIIETPGHTPGGVCLLINNHLFTGDTLFKNNIGRVDLHGGNKKELKESLKKLAKLPSDLILHPGHGELETLENILKDNKKFVEEISWVQ